MTRRSPRLWSDRLGTLRAAFALVLARLAVRLFPLKAFAGSLGQINDGTAPDDIFLVDADAREAAEWLARRVERASRRLPGTSKCLPKAIALQWALRRENIPSRLIVAAHRADRSGEHAFHAWVEQDGAMLIGHCDSDEYQPVMVFAQPRQEVAA